MKKLSIPFIFISSCMLFSSLTSLSLAASPENTINIPIPNNGVLAYNTPSYLRVGQVLPVNGVYKITCHMYSPLTLTNYLYINSGGVACVGKKINPTCISISITLNGEDYDKHSIIKRGDNVFVTQKIASLDSGSFISFTNELIIDVNPVLKSCVATPA